jgi:hypothetical protein
MNSLWGYEADNRLVTRSDGSRGELPRVTPTRNSSQLFWEQAVQAVWLTACGYDVSWHNKFEIEDTVSLEWTQEDSADLNRLSCCGRPALWRPIPLTYPRHIQSRDLAITMGFPAFSRLFIWMTSFDWLSGSSSEGSKHCTVSRALCRMEPPESITTPTLLSVRGLASRMQELGEGGAELKPSPDPEPKQGAIPAKQQQPCSKSYPSNQGCTQTPAKFVSALLQHS